MDVPQNWSNYQDSQVEIAFRRGFRGGVDTGILHRELLDTQMDKSEVLLNVPSTSSSSDVLWSPDSKSFLLCPTYLPLNVEDPIEFQLRRSSKFVVEIELPNRTVVKITNQDLTPVRWDLQTNVVEFHLRQKWDETQSVPESIHYRKTGKTWQRLAAAPKEVTDLPANILADQDLNMPPRIVVMDRETKQKTTLLDLNPQFAELAFGKVEEINWKDGTGNTVSGGLYFPPQYIPGKRYPLVIQTHGFEPGTFVIDGSHMTASAAQPLAGREIMVLQVKDIFYDSLDTPREAERVMSAYENAVEYLDQKGIVDRSHVGLAGFSRTCLYVKYTLTHSNQHFAAAIVADGVDAGYFRYLMYYNADPSEAAEYDSVIGAPPFGHGLSLWLKNSPGFLLDKVQTPLQIQAFSANSILGEWQWFEGLKRLGKPVDMLYLPAAAHILVKPWDRIASQGGTLDWFCFWLKGEEDPDPAKAEQYIRWRELRKLQEQNAQQPLQANPPSVH